MAARIAMIAMTTSSSMRVKPREALARIGSFSIYRPGVILAAQITLKSNAILLAFIALIATMSLATIGHALHRMGVPEKIVQLLLMTYRYVFVIEQEYQRLIRAAKIRGFRPGTNANTYRTYSHVIGMLFFILAEIGYRSAQVFEAIGLNREVVDAYFEGTVSRLEGIGLEEIAREQLLALLPVMSAARRALLQVIIAAGDGARAGVAAARWLLAY